MCLKQRASIWLLRLKARPFQKLQVCPLQLNLHLGEINGETPMACTLLFGRKAVTLEKSDAI